MSDQNFPEFNHPFEKEIWMDFIAALKKEQKNPNVETIEWSVRNHEKELKKALWGSWWDMMNESDEKSDEYIWGQDQHTIKSACKQSIALHRQLIEEFEEDLSDEESDDFDCDEYESKLVEQFIEHLDSFEDDLKYGYTYLKHEWVGSADITVAFSYPGMTYNEFYTEEEGLFYPSLELIGVLNRFKIQVEPFIDYWLEKYYREESVEIIQSLRESWEKASSDFNKKIGCISWGVWEPLVHMEDFASWLWNSKEQNEVLSSWGFKTTIHLSGGDLTQFLEDLSYRNENSRTMPCRRNDLSTIELGTGALLYCKDDCVTEPLKLINPLMVLCDSDEITLEDYAEGDDVSLTLPDVTLSRARYKLEQELRGMREGEHIDVDSDPWKSLLKNADITEEYHKQLQCTFPGILMIQKLSGRAFVEGEDVFPVMHRDLYVELHSEKGVLWGERQNIPILSQLLCSSPVGEVIAFGNECGLSITQQDKEGNTPLHGVMERIEQMKDEKTLSSVASWITPESLSIKNNEGKTPLDLLLNLNCREAIRRNFNKVPQEMINALDASGVNLYSRDSRLGNSSIAEALGFAANPVVERQKLMATVGKGASRSLNRM